MNRFVLEALVIGAKEGLKLSFCAFLVLSYLKQSGRQHLRPAFAAGLFAVFLASFAVMTLPVSPEVRDVIVRLIGYVFGLFFLFAIGALFHATGTDLLGPLAGIAQSRTFLVPVTTLLTILYFVPDMAGSSFFLGDSSLMSGAGREVYAAAGAGFAGILALAYGVSRRFRPDLSRLFDLPQVLLVLALVKLVAGGVQGFAELSLIPSVKAGLMKFVHDVVHQVFLLLLVPDHPVLSTTTWNFVGVLFGEAAGLWLSLLLLVLPLLLFMRKHFSAPIPVSADSQASARKRIRIKAVRDLRVQRALPVVVFLVFILGLWFHQKSETLDPLYLPDARPVVAEGGEVAIPLQSPLDDLRDGRAHKFVVTAGQKDVRILILKRPDGTLGVCLDACEICAPEGYGQAQEHVVCLYCKTPIPLAAVGSAGGCNPIPLYALVTDKEVRISLEELRKKSALIQSKQGAEGQR